MALKQLHIRLKPIIEPKFNKLKKIYNIKTNNRLLEHIVDMEIRRHELIL